MRPAPLELSIIFRRATGSWENRKKGHKFDVLLQFSWRRGSLKESGVKTEPSLESTLTLCAPGRADDGQ